MEFGLPGLLCFLELVRCRCLVLAVQLVGGFALGCVGTLVYGFCGVLVSGVGCVFC